MSEYQLHLGDCLEWARAYDGPRFHALLCDPPYHLTSGNVSVAWGDFDGPNSYGNSNRGQTNGQGRGHKSGFMGKQWDGGDIAFQPSTWATLAALLHPGAFIMAFAGTRGYHRMACAMEDAGLIAHPMCVWCFGSGFPKATRIDTQVDKAAGAEREIVGLRVTGDGHIQNRRNGKNNFGTFETKNDGYDVDTAPATPLARAWAGHRYGLQALKPALEPIAVFQVPYQGRPVDCITRTGAGALNVDGGRIGIDEVSTSGKGSFQSWVEAGAAGFTARHGGVNSDIRLGRWPANLLLSHSPGCNGHCVDGCPVKAMGEQSGESKSTSASGVVRYGRSGGIMGDVGALRDGRPEGHADTGTAARFFHNSDYALEQADPFVYCAKAARGERDAGLDNMPKRLVPFLEGDTRPGHADGSPSMPDNNRRVCYARNTHPTVKPLRLIQHLAALLLPPAEYAPRRLLVPFAGSGSEMIGASLAGWDEVVGIEREAEYADIARARLAHWCAQLRLPLETPIP